MSLDTFKSARNLAVKGHNYKIYAIEALEQAGIGAVSRLPFSLKILLEICYATKMGRPLQRMTSEPLGFGSTRVLLPVKLLSAPVVC